MGPDRAEPGGALRGVDAAAHEAAGCVFGVLGGGGGAAVCVLRVGGELRTCLCFALLCSRLCLSFLVLGMGMGIGLGRLTD